MMIGVRVAAVYCIAVVVLLCTGLSIACANNKPFLCLGLSGSYTPPFT